MRLPLTLKHIWLNAFYLLQLSPTSVTCLRTQLSVLFFLFCSLWCWKYLALFPKMAFSIFIFVCCMDFNMPISGCISFLAILYDFLTISTQLKSLNRISMNYVRHNMLVSCVVVFIFTFFFLFSFYFLLIHDQSQWHAIAFVMNWQQSVYAIRVIMTF